MKKILAALTTAAFAVALAQTPPAQTAQPKKEDKKEKKEEKKEEKKDEKKEEKK